MPETEAADSILKAAGLRRQSTTQVRFDFNKQKRSVYIQTESGQALSEKDLESAYDMLEVFEIAKSTPFYKDWKEDIRHILERLFFDSGAADRAMLGIWISALERWQNEVKELSEDEQYKRLRRFKPELVSYKPSNNSQVVHIDENALINFVKECSIRNEKKIIEIWSNYCFDMTLTYCLQDILNTPEENNNYHERIRKWADEFNKPRPKDKDFEIGGYAYQYIIELRLAEAVKEFSLGDLDNIISGFTQQMASVVSPIGTLEQIENRILGFIPDLPNERDELISKGDVPVAISEAMIAAVENTWKIAQNGEPYYEIEPLEDGLIVKMKSSINIEHALNINEEITRKSRNIDSLSVSINRLLQMQSECQENPWKDEFETDAQWLADNLNLGRLGRKSRSEQAREIIGSLIALGNLKIQIYWVNDAEKVSLAASKLWHFEIFPKWKDNRNHKTDIPCTYTVKVRPGEWAQQCNAEVNKHRNLLWVGIQPKGLLKQRASLKSQLSAVYYQSQQNEFTVYDWLVRARSRPKIDQLINNRYSKKDLKKAVQAAIKDLKELLKPTFDIKPNSDNWLQDQVVKKNSEVKPTSISEQLYKLRLKAGLTQSEVGEMVGYNRSRISQLEKGLLFSDDAAGRVKSALSQLTD
jgi:DNA-binding XRE family transcriptional regulator